MCKRVVVKAVADGYVNSGLKENDWDAEKKGYEGSLKRVTNDSEGMSQLSGICSVEGLGGNPYRDGSFEYYVKEAIVSDDFKGIGPFIYASMAAE